MLLTRVAAPALAGIAVGLLFSGNGQRSSVADEPTTATYRGIVRLPDDPEIVRIAVLAGRTREARARVADLLAANATDEEIADWLALILFSDPAWLDSFILTVPEDRRIALARLTIMKVGDLHSDAAWRLIRHSPFALLAARSEAEVHGRKGIDILSDSRRSQILAETVLDRALGLSDEEIAKTLSWAGAAENSKRILEEWKSGRWAGQPPPFVSNAWYTLRQDDPDSLQKLETGLSEEHRDSVDHLKAFISEDGRAPMPPRRHLKPGISIRSATGGSSFRVP